MSVKVQAVEVLYSDPGQADVMYVTGGMKVSKQHVKYGLSGRVLTGPKLHRLMPCTAPLHMSGLDSFGTDPKRLARQAP